MKIKRGAIVKCIKDVIMVDGEKTFTEGKFYRTYPYLQQDGWYVTEVICAKNDTHERHVIIDSEDDPFFNTHFEFIEIN